MEYKEITDLIKLIGKSNLSEFRLKKGDFELQIKTDKFQKISKGDATQSLLQAIPVPSPMVPAQPVQNIEVSAPDLPAKDEKEVESNLVPIKSPIVGTFYRAPSPDKEPYLNVGDRVAVGTVVCIVEAMKLFNEIESEVSGTVVKVVTDDASPVEYDQVLFMVNPD